MLKLLSSWVLEKEYRVLMSLFISSMAMLRSLRKHILLGPYFNFKHLAYCWYSVVRDLINIYSCCYYNEIICVPEKSCVVYNHALQIISYEKCKIVKDASKMQPGNS